MYKQYYELGAEQYLVHVFLCYASTKGSGDRFTLQTQRLYISQQGISPY